MKTKNYSIDRETIQKMKSTLWTTNTWYYKVAKKDVQEMHEIMGEMVDAYEELQKRNKLLEEVSITLIKN